jgi:hypothetical protein
MIDWGDWEVTRHRVTLYGRIREKDGTPAAGARVSVSRATPKPAKPSAKADNRGKRGTPLTGAPAVVTPEKRPFRDVTCTKADGIFFFLDLPEGEYAVIVEGERAGARVEYRETVVPGKTEGGRVTGVELKF